LGAVAVMTCPSGAVQVFALRVDGWLLTVTLSSSFPGIRHIALPASVIWWSPDDTSLPVFFAQPEIGGSPGRAFDCPNCL